MKTQVVQNSDLHFEHKQWENELLFWRDEMKSFQNRLDELVLRWTDKEVLKKLDYFQNRFIINNNIMEEMMNSINTHEHNISKHDELHEDSLDRIYFKEHLEFRDKIENQRHMYTDLKKEFFTFLTKYM
ncbi:hypothetical protein [Psychroserpens ponticola]|uniref:Uncharacterized protein n=1 Tax=Psychroserpens ponticola TaxID=2932268 RepID=A0ABY7S0T0_9FLAO|nr:hypothetical protein [Psychroserpens ponticola]WCO02898.1 hypothetical protein MUN68_005245 [Psychroserpens ponticola]